SPRYICAGKETTRGTRDGNGGQGKGQSRSQACPGKRRVKGCRAQAGKDREGRQRQGNAAKEGGKTGYCILGQAGSQIGPQKSGPEDSAEGERRTAGRAAAKAVAGELSEEHGRRNRCAADQFRR